MDILLKLQSVAKDAFEDLKDIPNYPHQRWEDQYSEMKAAYEIGALSESFINFAYNGDETDFNSEKAN